MTHEALVFTTVIGWEPSLLSDTSESMACSIEESKLRFANLIMKLISLCAYNHIKF